MTNFAKLRTGYPGELDCSPDPPGAWAMYELCDREKRSSSLAHADVAAILSDKDTLHVRKTLVHFRESCKTGMDLAKLYEIESCHIAHTCKRGNPPVETQVWRIRGGDTRIYFMYLPGKKIVILKLASKRTRKLSVGETTELDARVALVNDALIENKFSDLEIDDEK
jgi:mRNA-degrading endonuclease RelE of RelBE toxin-antitoxin system